MAFFLRNSTSLLSFRAFRVQINRKHIHLTCLQFEQQPPPSNETSNQSETENKQNETENDDVRTRILEASLPFVHTHGWTKNAIVAGAESMGYPGTTHGLFQQGGADLVHHFYASCNQQLAVKLKQESEAGAADPNKQRAPHIFVTDAIQFRLELIVPYLSHWPQAMGLMALPNNTPRALANLLTMVDDVCYYAGDRSIDITWYSRRLALAGIYKLSELYLLQDSTPGHQATWTFLNRRIEDALQFQSVLESSGSAGVIAKEFATATFTTARNILGLNWNR
uniref:Ubiquinone biosynthesis protein n=1 Tax=Cacopsylla melanoneura TaxID=428564 RepID=A0A8D8VFZ8_9HEMI